MKSLIRLAAVLLLPAALFVAPPTVQAAQPTLSSSGCVLTNSGAVICAGGSNTPEPNLTRLVSSVAEEGCVIKDGAVRCGGTNVPNFPLDVKAVSRFRATTADLCILTEAGAVKCRGINNNGQLGNGTNDDSPTLVDVVGLSSGVASVSVHGDSACALTTAGGVKCWGEISSSTTPVDVLGLSSGVASIAGGAASGLGNPFSCALTSAGGVKCWGSNNRGQLGDGTQTGSSTPVDVLGLSSGVKAISATDRSACALTLAGAVKCWGGAAGGRLGNGTTGLANFSATPVDVTGLSSGVAAISAGSIATCALTDSSQVFCWGNNRLTPESLAITFLDPDADGLTDLTDNCPSISNPDQANADADNEGDACDLNDDNDLFTDQQEQACGSSAVDPAAVCALTTVPMVQAGPAHTCTVTAAGAAKCWGSNFQGELGNGTLTSSTTPGDVLGLNSGVAAIAVANDNAGSARHTCALTTSGGVKCWGDNALGQLGNGGGADQLAPVDVTGLSSGVAAISIAYGAQSYSCALMTAGTVKCWGGYPNIDGTRGNSSTPVDVAGVSGVMAISAAINNRMCALTVNGSVKCWGPTDISSTDTTAPFIGDAVSAISASSGVRTGALTTAGAVKFWDQASLPTSVDVAGLGSNVAAVSFGPLHACALPTAGGVKCWGTNSDGQLGDGTTTTSNTPVDVAGLSSGVAGMSAGKNHSCALTTTGGVKCWGSNSSGQLGNGDGGNPLMPVDVLLDEDGDGFLNGPDNCPTLASADLTDSDVDGRGNACDDDDDNDGVLDIHDAFPLDNAETSDPDGDGIGNNADPDDDNDGILDGSDSQPLSANVSTRLMSVAAKDGWVLESTEKSRKGGKADSASSTVIVGDSANNQEYRSILHFDTANLPNNAVISKATLTLKRQSFKGNVKPLGNLVVDLKQKNFGSSASVAVHDFEAPAGKLSVGALRAVGKTSTYSAVLSTTGRSNISRTAATQFKIHFTTDDNNDKGDDYLSFFSGNASSSSRPSLTIEYYVP